MPREDIVGELAVLWIECDGVEHNGLGPGSSARRPVRSRGKCRARAKHRPESHAILPHSEC